MKRSIIIAQSGGPTAAINSSLQGIVDYAMKDNEVDHIYGAINGIDGIINGRIIDIKNESLDEIKLLKTTPGTILGSARYKLIDYNEDDKDYKKITNVFKKLNIKSFFLIGGNDSMDTCSKINKYFKHINFDCTVIGIPKTIDNDLEGTDHSPGFGSSIKYIATVTSEIAQDISCYTKGKVTILEVMGRDAGWLTAGAHLANLIGYGPDLIYLPEVPFSVDKFLENVKKIYEEKSYALVVVSEGIKDKDDNYILKYRLFNNEDDFGHLQLGGVGQVLAEIVNKKLGYPIRSVELNLPQRCSSHLNSKTDIDEAYNCGKYGYLMAKKGKTGKMVSMIRTKEYKIKYSLVDIDYVANKIKQVPRKYILEDGCHISDKFIKYALPLVKGSIKLQEENGLQKYATFNKTLIKFLD